MSLPEGWEWLDELPPDWSPPAEITVPTGMPRVDLPIRMLSSKALGNDLIDLVGQLLSAGARFTMWFGAEAKTKVASPKDLAELLVASGEQIRHVYEAWQAFIDAYTSSNAMVGAFTAEEDALRNALRAAITELTEMRTRYSQA